MVVTAAFNEELQVNCSMLCTIDCLKASCVLTFFSISIYFIKSKTYNLTASSLYPTPKFNGSFLGYYLSFQQVLLKSTL